MRLYALDVGLARRGYVLEYALELIERRRAREHGRAEQHLAQNASDTPHVDAFRVFGRGEEDLGRAVPSRSHVLGERRIRRELVVVRLLGERTRQTKVAQLHVTLLIEQNIRRLLIPVYDVRRVQVLGCLQQLIHDVLLVHVFQNGLAFDHVVQVGLHVLEHEVNVTVVVGFDHVVEFDDVRVFGELFEKHDLAICSLLI